MNSPILKTKHLSKHFDGVAAVDGVSLEFQTGQITGLVGPNGSGKTTLTNLLSGVLPFEKGVIVVGEKTLHRLPAYKSLRFGITRTFQEVRLFEQMPVLDNVLVVLTERGVIKSFLETHTEIHLAQAKMVLDRVGLWDKRNSMASELSYGQRKLLEIARVLAMVNFGHFGKTADIILLDEPFAGLFPHMVDTVVEIIRELRTKNKAVILIEHNMEIIRKLCNKLFVLDSGKLLAEGEPNNVLSQPEVIEAYLGL
jgi:ABC-type branched-subunit amino acid transport system ATPase component